jgi:predicted ATPase/DNA-binding CsgD family transcriptional regulator
VRLARLPRGCEIAALEEEIAHSVIDGDFSGRSTWTALVDALTRTGPAPRIPRTVLVLDNCEHVLTAVASVITRLLESAPELAVLATSREPIGWVDEHLVRVPPLSRRHALTLFRQRAELTGYPITGPDQTDTAATICHRVHNYPLYIQLAAARLTHRPPTMILHGLTGRIDDARLRWSHGYRSGADSRHRGVGDVITWSYELCTDKERLLFDRLSVFAAGYDTHPDDAVDPLVDVGADLDAIRTICSDDNDAVDSDATDVTLTSDEIEHLLERLVDHALVWVHRTPTTVRYALVETLRVYAQDRLHRRSRIGIDEPGMLAERHLRYYRDRICYAAAHWPASEGQHLLGSIRIDRANTLIALETGVTTPDRAILGLEICIGLFTMQNYVDGSIREMRSWIQRSLDATRALEVQPIALQVAGSAAIAGLALNQGRSEETVRILEDCVTACIDHAEIRTAWRDTAETDIGLPAAVEYAWGYELLFAQRDVRAVDVFLRARDKFLAAHNYGSAALSELHATLAASLLGTAARAQEITRRYVDRVDTPATPWEKSWAGLIRAIALTRFGDPGEALKLERTASAFLLGVGDRWAGMWAVQVRIWILARLITDQLAADGSAHNRLVALASELAQLAGGAATVADGFGVVGDAMGPLTDRSANAVAVARRVLGPAAYAAAVARGRRRRLEGEETQQPAQTTSTVGAFASTRPAEREPFSHWRDLSRAEREVAVLAAAGWTNTAIADRRGKSTRTIDAQISAILRKLAIVSREDIIEHIPREIIDDVRIEAAHGPGGRSRKT